ncbi:MAG TPA: hypothetical protein ENH93_07730 [Pseudohongiella sp.]|nr:hypothetical protein [Pseudohongiella sp.]HDZ07482.1 hypothetical protein [Pseudohongiella sp.]HEA63013.1 hypothetical protein [Pseudohongiella sp.]
MKTTAYFDRLHASEDRSYIRLQWIQAVIESPIREVTQNDGRIRLWGSVPEMENRFLRVVLLSDRETVHNAFFDRRFRP